VSASAGVKLGSETFGGWLAFMKKLLVEGFQDAVRAARLAPQLGVARAVRLLLG